MRSIPAQLRIRCITRLLASLLLTRHTTMDTSSPPQVTQVRHLQGNELGVPDLCDKRCRLDGYSRVMTYFTET